AEPGLRRSVRLQPERCGIDPGFEQITCRTDLARHPLDPVGVLLVCRPQLAFVDELDRFVAGCLGKTEQGCAPAAHLLVPWPKTTLSRDAVEMLDDDMGVGEHRPVI